MILPVCVPLFCCRQIKLQMAKSKDYSLFQKQTGGTLPWKMVSETQIDLGKVFNQLKKIEKHMQRPMTPSWYSTWPPESNLILKIADSMSNESPNSVLQDVHAYYRNQSPNRWRISVCSSIQAAAVRSWTSKGATPGKASWSLFESV